MKRTPMLRSRQNPVQRPRYRPHLDTLEDRLAPGDAFVSVIGMTMNPILSILGPGASAADFSLDDKLVAERQRAHAASAYGLESDSLNPSSISSGTIFSEYATGAQADSLTFISEQPATGSRPLKNSSSGIPGLTGTDPEDGGLFLAASTSLGQFRGFSGSGPENSPPTNSGPVGAPAAGNPDASSLLPPVAPPGNDPGFAGLKQPPALQQKPAAPEEGFQPGVVAFSTGVPPGGGEGGVDPRIFQNSYLDDWVGPGDDPSVLGPFQASGENRLPDVLNPDRNGGFSLAGISSTSTDPGAPGPFSVLTQEYNFGDTAFTVPGFPGPIELTASVTAPTNLVGQLPLIVLLHGRHSVSYNPTTGATGGWPAPAGFVPIPSYRGYDYLGQNLASHGYIVVSISADGINAVDNSTADAGMSARAQLVQRHLDIWNNLNTGSGVVSPFGIAPFGTRFVGHVNMQNIGTMGHSRGGEGVVRNFILNQSLGAPYGIKAVFELAPVDFQRPVINNVAQAVLLPYNDGDVSDNQGAHFYDDSRYNVPGDLSPKHIIQVIGANHNSYNTVWVRNTFPGGTFDDGIGVVGVTRLTDAQVRGTGLAYMSAFFRAYLGNEQQFLPLLRGDAPPPPSSLVGPDQIHITYHAPDSATFRRDVNRLLNTPNLTTNTLGGAVTQSGLAPYDLAGGLAPQPQHALTTPPAGSAQQPHTTPSSLAAGVRGLSQLRASWNAPGAFWQNDLPAGFRDISGYYALQFRAAVNFQSALNAAGLPQNFSVTLTDGANNTATTLVNTSSNALFFPPQVSGTVLPKVVLNTIRIPIRAFQGINLTDVRSIRFNFDQTGSGYLLITDLAFADPSTVYAGPFVVTSTSSNAGGGLLSSIRVTFDSPLNVSTFTAADVALTAPNGAAIAVTSISAVAGTSNRQFDINFAAQTQVGSYNLALGPIIQDTLGRNMDQNFNGTAGESTADRYVTQFTPTIDDGEPSFSATAGFAAFPGQGNLGDVRFAAAGTGSEQAIWTFTGLAAGQYRVSTTWTPNPNRATNAPYTVFDGTTSGTNLGTFLINQEATPLDFVERGVGYRDLSTTPFTINSGTLTVRLTNAANEFVIADSVRIERLEPQIIDNGSAGFSATPGFTPFAGQGFGGSVHFASQAPPNETATWTFTNLLPGIYRVSATWSTHPNRATDAPFTIRDGTSTTGINLGTVRVNQELAPNHFTANGASWFNLGGVYRVNSGTLSVQLSNSANEFVIADAVRVERLIADPSQVIDESALTGFSATSGFFSYTWNPNQGFNNVVRYAFAGTGTQTATWAFTGLAAGTYRVSATWSEDPNRATNTPYTVFDGTIAGINLGTFAVNQELAPGGFFTAPLTLARVGWTDLGTGVFTINSGTLTVRLTDLANEVVIADALRIERLT